MITLKVLNNNGVLIYERPDTYIDEIPKAQDHILITKKGRPVKESRRVQYRIFDLDNRVITLKTISAEEENGFLTAHYLCLEEVK